MILLRVYVFFCFFFLSAPAVCLFACTVYPYTCAWPEFKKRSFLFQFLFKAVLNMSKATLCKFQSYNSLAQLCPITETIRAGLDVLVNTRNM